MQRTSIQGQSAAMIRALRLGDSYIIINFNRYSSSAPGKTSPFLELPYMGSAKRDVPLSKNHRLVYEIIVGQGGGHHLGMADLFNLARAKRPEIGFSTVYRALIRLRGLGLISEIALPGADRAYYEPAGASHAHFRCTACGSVSDVQYALPPETIESIALDLGADVANATINLDGRCANCAAI